MGPGDTPVPLEEAIGDFASPTVSWGFSFALGHGVSFFSGIQHCPVDGCSTVLCNFGVLMGEDECTSFYSTILWVDPR